MKAHPPLRYAAWFCITTGTLNLGMWAWLILSGSITDFQAEPVSYIFHWVSEFSTALLLILAGNLLLRKHRHATRIFFLSAGFLLMAIGGAFIYYLFDFEAAPFVLSAIITGGTIIIIILTYRGFRDFILITLGAVTYAFLNITGKAITNDDISVLSMAVPALVFTVIVALNILGKEVTFIRNPSNK